MRFLNEFDRWLDCDSLHYWKSFNLYRLDFFDHNHNYAEFRVFWKFRMRKKEKKKKNNEKIFFSQFLSRLSDIRKFSFTWMLLMLKVRTITLSNLDYLCFFQPFLWCNFSVNQILWSFDASTFVAFLLSVFRVRFFRSDKDHQNLFFSLSPISRVRFSRHSKTFDHFSESFHCND